MIYFISNRNHPNTYERCSIEDVLAYFEDATSISYDKEFNGLDAWTTIPLLTILGDEINQFVIDDTSVDITALEPLKDHLFIGHNIKIDFKVSMRQGLHLKNAYDTMIVDQTLMRGLNKTSGGFRYSLDAVIERRLGERLVEKDVRQEFLHMDSKSLFENKHIEYAAGDVKYLTQIRRKQKILIERYDMDHLIYGIELPLIHVLAKAEMEGFVLDKEIWKKNISNNKEKKKAIEIQLDSFTHDLFKDNPNFRGSKYLRERKTQEILQTDMFGEGKLISNKNEGNMNWSSDMQIKQLFKDVGFMPPTTKTGSETVGKDHLEQLIISEPHHKLRPLIENLIKYSELNKELSTYGENFFNLINPVTGKLHTTFRQCSTDTGRLSSGDKAAGYINLQNIPAKPLLRTAFKTDPGYEITTCDLSGAELIIMCSLSQDMRLLKLSQGDMHSHMANLCWKHIYARRGEEWTDADVISKKQNKNKRTAFKAMTFGAVYGMYAKKAAEQLGVSPDEGQIVIDAIEDEVPDVFKMVKAASKFAEKKGYVIHNTRTNSRRWFKPLLDSLKGEDVDFITKSSSLSAARNTRIQGSQADMIKEAMVYIDDVITAQNLDALCIGQVHDELIYKHKKGLKVFSPYLKKEMLFGDFVNEAMRRIANLYLNGVEMGAEHETLDSWTK